MFSRFLLSLLILAASLMAACAKSGSHHAIQKDIQQNAVKGVRGLDEKKSKKSSIEARIEEEEDDSSDDEDEFHFADELEFAERDGNFTDFEGNFTDFEGNFTDFNETDFDDIDFNETEGVSSDEFDFKFNETDFNETDFNETEFILVEENNSTGILIQLSGEESCISYSNGLEVVDCETAGEAAVWIVVESADPALFQLRHAESGLCLPENPESPDEAFSCWIDEDNQAIADTINGLVDCGSDFAAFVGFIDPANPSYLYNAICSTGEVGADSDIVLMAYTVNGETQILWGEKVLLGLSAAGAAPYALDGSWIFEA
jgi:hypothetical protein